MANLDVQPNVVLTAEYVSTAFVNETSGTLRQLAQVLVHVFWGWIRRFRRQNDVQLEIASIVVQLS
jgi:hypothetical protein